MTYIMIVLSWFAGNAQGYHVTHVEFNGERACLEAATQVSEKGNSSFNATRIVAVCVRKGDRI